MEGRGVLEEGRKGFSHCIDSGFEFVILGPWDADKAGCRENTCAVSGCEKGGLGLGRGSV